MGEVGWICPLENLPPGEDTVPQQVRRIVQSVVAPALDAWHTVVCLLGWAVVATQIARASPGKTPPNQPSSLRGDTRYGMVKDSRCQCVIVREVISICSIRTS